MKTRNLFLSLFAFAALCACNKEVQPEVPQVLENDAYVTVSIVAPSSVSTRGESGNTDFDGGTDKENEVSSAMFIFFNGSGDDAVFSQAATPTLTFADESDAASPFVEKISEATVILRAQDIAPTHMLVVLNAPEGFNIASGTTLGAVKDMVNNYSSTEKFVMTNSVWTAEGVQATDITSNIKTSAAEAIADPVTVYVERVLAKVNVTDTGWVLKDGTGNTADYLTLILDSYADVNGDGILNDVRNIQVKPVIKGYILTNTATTSYLYKDVTGWNIDNWVYDATNFRSYWATSAATTFNTFKYAEAAASTLKTFYCQENTTATDKDKTSLIAAVQFMTVADPDVAVETFYKYEGDFYSEAGLKAVAVGLLKGAGLTYNAGDIEISLGGTDHEVKVGISSSFGDDEKAAAANALTTMTNVWKWGNGQAYYYTNIEHFGDDKDGNDLVGVVRNHVYNLTVNSLKGFGIPVGGGDDIVVPEPPTTEEYENLAATINILQWKVVSQSVDFE